MRYERRSSGAAMGEVTPLLTTHSAGVPTTEGPGEGTTQYATGCLKNSAHEAIRDAILTGRYAPGMQLKEISIAAGLGLSRTPVRHALAKLAAEGLVAEVPHVGMFVRKPTRAEMGELLGLRRVVEAGAAALASERATPAECAELRRMAERVDNSISVSPRPEVEQSDLDFHRRIVEMAGNKEVERVFANAQRFFFTLAFYPEAGERLCAERVYAVSHVEIADAIAAGDSGRAFKVMWDHLSSVKSYL